MKKITLCILFFCLFIFAGCDSQIKNEQTKEESNQTKQTEKKQQDKQQNDNQAEKFKQEQCNLLQNKLDSLNANCATNFIIKSFGDYLVSITDSSAIIEYSTPQNYTTEYTLLYNMLNGQYKEISTYSTSPEFDYLLKNKFPEEINYFVILAESLGLITSQQKENIKAFLTDAGNTKETKYTHLNDRMVGLVKEYDSLYNIRYKLTISIDSES